MLKTAAAAIALTLATAAAQAATSPADLFKLETISPITAEAIANVETIETAYYCEWVTLYDYWGNWVTVYECY